MDEQTTPLAPSATPEPSLVTSVPQPPSQPKKFSVLGIVTIVVIILALVGGGILAQKSNLFSPQPTTAPSPQTLQPTPTPERHLSLIATQSAFLQLQSNVASLSASIQNVIVSDPILSPPVLDLPLGFSN